MEFAINFFKDSCSLASDVASHALCPPKRVSKWFVLTAQIIKGINK
jgi:hypothetical protein